MTEATRDGRRAAIVAGMRRALVMPGLVLAASAFGFGAFARASGFDIWQSLVTATIFALPSQLVLADAVASGAGLAAAAVAVTLTAVRLLPLTVALMPMMRREDTPLWQQIFLAHFVAVTPWVESMRRFPDLRREYRIPFYIGLSLTLFPMVLVATVLGHVAAGSVAPTVAAGLMFLTPIYFLLSMLAAARESLDTLAIGVGLILGPIFSLLAPGFDLLLTGFVGGTAAYAFSRRWMRR